MAGRLRYTDHAHRRMAERDVSEDDVESVLAAPERTTVGATAIEYDGLVGGRPLGVVVVRGSDPPLVITVIIRNPRATEGDR